MITIDNAFRITMTRGDTFQRTLVLTKNGETYTPQEGDVIRFAMSKKFEGQNGYALLLEKTIPNDTLLWTIDAEETKMLPYGTYNYDLQITYADGSVETFADKKTIKLTEEVL